MPFFSPVTSGGGGGGGSTTTQVFRYNSTLPTNTDGSLVYGETDINGIPYVNPGVYNTTSFTQAGVSVLVTSTSILAANPARTYLLIQNQDATNPIWISLTGITAVANNSFLKIAAGGVYEINSAICANAITGISTGGPVFTHVIQAS